MGRALGLQGFRFRFQGLQGFGVLSFGGLGLGLQSFRILGLGLVFTRVWGLSFGVWCQGTSGSRLWVLIRCCPPEPETESSKQGAACNQGIRGFCMHEGSVILSRDHESLFILVHRTCTCARRALACVSPVMGSSGSEMEGFRSLNPTWTPKVCRKNAFYRFWAIILPTFGGLGIHRYRRLICFGSFAQGPCIRKL